MAKLCPVLNWQQLDANGIILANGKIETYLAGSSTLATTFKDEAGLVPQSNPILLNTRGEPDSLIYLTAGVAYKFIRKDALNNVIGQPLDYITGVNDVGSSVDQFQTFSGVPTFISATSFTLVGDQTTVFHVGRRVKLTVSAGTVYGYISASVFAALTTITVSLDAGAVDAGLSAVAYGILTVSNPSYPAVTDTLFRILKSGSSLFSRILATSLTANRDYSLQDKSGTLAHLDDFPSVRQSILSALVDSTGLPNFMTGVGLTTLTVTGSVSTPFVCSAANGAGLVGSDRTGFSTSNLTLAGLNTNGTFTIYATISIAGVITLSAQNQATLTPVYQAGGTPAVTSGLFTFNYQQMQGFLCNGTTAPQAYMVALGEVTVAANVISTLTPYGLMGRFTSVTSTLPAIGTALSFNHNIGLSIENLEVSCKLRATAADVICAAGEILDFSNMFFVGALSRGIGSYSSSKNNWTLRSNGAYEAIGSLGVGSFANTNYTALVLINRKW